MTEQQFQTQDEQKAEQKGAAEVESKNGAAAKKSAKKHPMRLAALVMGALLLAALLYWLSTRNYEDTDDAEVEAHIAPVAARVDGTVRSVFVDDNTVIQAGQPLVNLDPTDSQVALGNAEAKYQQAEAEISAQNPNLPITQLNNVTSLATQQAAMANAEAALGAAQHDYDNAVAMLEQARANNDRAQADYQRYKLLYSKKEVSQAEYQSYAATAAADQAAVAANEASAASAKQVIAERQADLNEQQAKLAQLKKNAPRQIAIQQATLASKAASAASLKTQVEQARLNLQYCNIVAPVAGIVMQRSAEIGDRISAGQQLMMIVETGDLWVTANFKETQLARIHPGQHVSLHVDALGKDFAGTVQSIGGATGSMTSVLPPENATGNYVKVVQRLPVRIQFDTGQAGLSRLRPGMSVEPKVHVN
jgi:membrane fusion protein (multidrug efflux system)